jgi:hypothetical protein
MKAHSADVALKPSERQLAESTGYKSPYPGMALASAFLA